MLTQPQLIKSDKTEKKAINLKSPTSSRARFLLGLNNKVSRIDKRLYRVENTTEHLLRNSIGYRELGLTFILALLIFTSVTLAIREFNPSNQFTPEMLKSILQHMHSQSVATAKPTTPTPYLLKSNDQFKWPLERKPQVDDIDYTNHKHGIELIAKLGDPVVSIEQGTVLYSGDAINSYGNLILIQHSNDIISVYGNNYSNYVNEGDKVDKGQLIAAVGEGNGKQPKLYFEIRYKGKAQDPFNYFKN